ncbi:MAG: RES family NAD+ phosphorylase [Acidobacteria bacterium]|nr:RES family NAD+ phosphorylase [Acidobacteriota bacterium]
MTLWRVTNHVRLDGGGGLRAPGRWHTRGRRIVYCAPDPAAALLGRRTWKQRAEPVTTGCTRIARKSGLPRFTPTVLTRVCCGRPPGGAAAGGHVAWLLALTRFQRWQVALRPCRVAPYQNISFSAKRNWRSVACAVVTSVNPFRLVMTPLELRVAEEAVAPGLLNAGVLDTLNASARNWSLNRSVMRKSRNMLASKFTRPGPRRMFLPLFPKRTAVTGANAYGSK